MDKHGILAPEPNILCGWLNYTFLIYLNYININKINFGVVVWIFIQKA